MIILDNIKITNKLESIEIINKLNLNKFPEQLFKSGQEDEVSKFIDSYPNCFFAIRDKSRAGGVFKLKVNYDEVINEIRGYDLFTINVSSANYEENQILVGEIEILSNGLVYAILSTDSRASVRDALRNPIFNINTNIFDKKLNKIPYFDFIYDYIVRNKLVDMIVEFSLFNIDVGINNEKIIIYEVRTHY